MAILGQLPLARREARFCHEVGAAPCHDASAKTWAMASLIPPWSSSASIGPGWRWRFQPGQVAVFAGALTRRSC